MTTAKTETKVFKYKLIDATKAWDARDVLLFSCPFITRCLCYVFLTCLKWDIRPGISLIWSVQIWLDLIWLLSAFKRIFLSFFQDWKRIHQSFVKYIKLTMPEQKLEHKVFESLFSRNIENTFDLDWNNSLWYFPSNSNLFFTSVFTIDF